MESQSATKQPLSEVAAGKSGMEGVLCKCGKGWTCVITKTQGPDAGKAFFKCGESCCCTIDGEVLESGSSEVSGETYCKCGEGWSCVITKTEESDAGKPFYDCAGDCKCVV